MSDKSRQYELMELRRDGLEDDPYVQFEKWYAEAVKSEIKYPDAFVLSTSTESGEPSSRVLLYKGRSSDGFKFYTNIESKKGAELKINSRASICFWWDVLERQLRIDGIVELLTEEEMDSYFSTRPRGSQLGAWASRQSSVLQNREELESKFAELEGLYEGKEITRPDYWVGYSLKPSEFEFWQGRKDRLHDRFRYRVDEEKGWIIERLSP